MRNNTVLAVAEFDPRLPKYFLLQSSVVMLFSFFLIPLLPFWILWIGRAVHRRQYDALSATLTDRALNVSKGFMFKTQKNIPLDKITDLAVNEGPILRYLGLCSLQIETAGGGQQNAMGHASLPGVVEALEFRDRVLEQRDLVCGASIVAPPVDIPAANVGAHGTSGQGADAPATIRSTAVLTEILGTLQKIEAHLSK